MKFIFYPFIYILSYLFVKYKNRWCIGAWFGQKYTDNTKYLYEELTSNSDFSHLDVYWVTKNIEIFNKLRDENKKVVLAGSLKGIYIQLTSKVFVCCVNSKDFFFPAICRRNIFFQLNHGMPLKKIGFDIRSGIYNKCVNYLRRFLIDNYDYTISSARIFDKPISTALQIKTERIIRIGNPRCDGFDIGDVKINEIRKNLNINNDEKYVLYLPTHRNEGKNIIALKSAIEELLEFDDDFLQHKIKIKIKLHPYDEKNLNQLKLSSKFVTIIDPSTKYDVYELMASSDALITDYSSVMFEYDLQHKPIYFYVPDIESYINTERGLYFEYSDLISTKLNNGKELVAAVLSEETNSGFTESIFNEGDGSNISERLAKIMLRLIN